MNDTNALQTEFGAELNEKAAKVLKLIQDTVNSKFRYARSIDREQTAIDIFIELWQANKLDMEEPMIVFHVCNRMVDALRKEMVRSKHLKLYDGFAPLAKEYILEKDWSANVGSESSVEDLQSDNVELVNYLMEVTDLNSNQRKLIHAYFYQQKSIQEIAEDFNRDPKIIKKALRQVIGMLQQSVVTLSQEVNFI